MVELHPHKFQRELQKVLRPDNAFYMKAGKMDDNTGSFETIKYNYANAIGKGKTGSPSLPLGIKSNEAGYSEYSTVQIYNDPYLIKNEDEMLTNFSKMQDAQDQLKEEFQTQIADIAANAWGAATNIIETTGTTRSKTLVNGTGNCKGIAKNDILNIVKTFKKMNVAAGNIVGVVTPDQYDDLLNIANFIDYEKTGRADMLAKGVIGQLLGINFMTRWNADLGSVGLHYATGGTKKNNYKTSNGNIVANTVATDRAAALFFTPNGVRHSLKIPRIVINRDVPGYLGGTIIEGFGRYGATISRQHDEVGVVTLLETNV